MENLNRNIENPFPLSFFSFMKEVEFGDTSGMEVEGGRDFGGTKEEEEGMAGELGERNKLTRFPFGLMFSFPGC